MHLGYLDSKTIIYFAIDFELPSHLINRKEAHMSRILGFENNVPLIAKTLSDHGIVWMVRIFFIVFVTLVYNNYPVKSVYSSNVKYCKWRQS